MTPCLRQRFSRDGVFRNVSRSWVCLLGGSAIGYFCRVGVVRRVLPVRRDGYLKNSCLGLMYPSNPTSVVGGASPTLSFILLSAVSLNAATLEQSVGGDTWYA